MSYQNEKKPQPDPPKAKPTEDELVERNRERVRDLEARGYLVDHIHSILRVPYAVIYRILNTPAPPKKGQ